VDQTKATHTKLLDLPSTPANFSEKKMRTLPGPSKKTPWGRAVSVLMLALCLTAPALTLADAAVPDGVFYDTIPGTITGMAVADARRAENPGGGG
jgi:hypothetical protein